jgi:hypothetical protein
MTDPMTKAGRSLYDELMENGYLFEAEDILAIEAEARADALREAADRVRALRPPDRFVALDNYEQGVSEAAVLAILDPETKP